MNTSDLSRHVSRHQETASRIIDGEAVILRPMDNRILDLNETGTRIWELLANHPTIEEVIQTLAREFDVAPDAAAKDTFSFLEELKAKDLIQLA